MSRSAANGEISAQITTKPPSASTAATAAVRRTFSERSSSEKPRSTLSDGAQRVAVEHVDVPAAIEEHPLHRHRERRFSGARQSGQPEDAAGVTVARRSFARLHRGGLRDDVGRALGARSPNDRATRPPATTFVPASRTKRPMLVVSNSSSAAISSRAASVTTATSLFETDFAGLAGERVGIDHLVDTL